MSYAIKALGFDPEHLQGLSARLLLSHHENNYSGAVKRLNAIRERLATLDYGAAPVFEVNGLKREELIAANSAFWHELYFAGLAGSTTEPAGDLHQAMENSFGSLERWRQEFVAMGKALGGGSGWVILSYSAREGRLVNHWGADHTHGLAGAQPLLALDMYEHSYHMDFGARAAAYVDAFMTNLRWDRASELFRQTMGGQP